MDKVSQIYDDPVASFRLRALKHQEEYGWKAACDAFQISKSSLYRWRQTYLASRKKPASLKKKSTKPHHLRQMEVELAVIEEIKRLREKHYRLGKEKIKPLLDEFCEEKELTSISVSTIGKVIKRHHFFFQKQGRIYHSPAFRQGQRPRLKRLRVKHSWLPREIGHLQMDTVVKLADRMKRYAISVMDVKAKFSLTLVYPRLTSLTALDLLLKYQQIYPLPIKSIQTDNGLEFLGVFDQYLKQQGIKHYFTYPRCPQINAFIERYNRTFQEEFLDPHLDLLHYPEKFHDKLLEYLVFFNTKRVHQGLNNQTPMDYLIEKGYFSQMYATRTAI